MTDRIVIVGAGQAAAQAAQSLRGEGFAGPVTIIGDEPHPPYQRPPLSKKFLAGELSREQLLLRRPEHLAAAGVELRQNTRVETIDRKAKSVRLSGGATLGYAQLLIATGSRVRKVNFPGSDLPGIFYIRTIADVEAVRGRFKNGARLVVVGGGYIGLEVAAVAVKHGLSVTVLELAERVMQRVVCAPISEFYERVHKEAGVALRTRVPVEGFEGGGKVTGVRAGGATIPADLVIVGVGIEPNVELARDAGLGLDNGIAVDEMARTSDPAIFAAGDCTSQVYVGLGRRVRLESVQNAIDQAKIAAAAIAGKPMPHLDVPWFWSDQYDLKLQIAGLAEPSDECVLRGDPSTRKFAVFRLRQGVIAAVEAVNAVPEFMIGKKLIAGRAAIAPAKLADLSLPMKSFAP